MIAKKTPRPVVIKESVKAITSSTIVGRPHLVLHSLLNSCVSVLFILSSLPFFKKKTLLLPLFWKHYFSLHEFVGAITSNVPSALCR